MAEVLSPLNEKQTVAALNKRASTIRARASRLEGMQTLLGQQLTKLTAEVATAKGRATLTPEVSKVLETMQKRAVERSVGAFERVLSAILSDVLPEHGCVKLTPSLKYSSPGLDIEVEKNGNLEDVLDSNGGALTNVISIGLRYAALSRTNLRRFMTLDESDCWVQSERISVLANVLSQVASKSGIQTMFISHHLVELFDDSITIVRLTKDEKTGSISAAVVGNPQDTWSSLEQPGIRSVHLKNFGGFKDTVIPGFPGLVVYTGNNNLGKSMALVQSMKAVAYGTFPENRIRHGESQGSVAVTIEKGQTIECTRYRNKSPAVVYRLYQAGNPEPIRETKQKTRGEAPEWVQDLLGIRMERDIDIQLGNQKSPVFLLDDTSTKRAELLSIGRESEHLKDAMRRFEALKSQDRDFIKNGELEAAAITQKIDLLRSGELYIDILASAMEDFDELPKSIEDEEDLGQLLAELQAGVATKNAIEAVEALLRKTQAPVEPRMDPVESLGEVIGSLEKLGKAKELNLPTLPDSAPVLEDVADLLEVGLALKSEPMLKFSESKLTALPVPTVTSEDLQSALNLKVLADEVGSHAGSVAQQMKALEEIQASVASEEQAFDHLKEKLKVCPLCGSGFSAHATHQI